MSKYKQKVKEYEGNYHHVLLTELNIRHKELQKQFEKSKKLNEKYYSDLESLRMEYELLKRELFEKDEKLMMLLEEVKDKDHKIKELVQSHSLNENRDTLRENKINEDDDGWFRNNLKHIPKKDVSEVNFKNNIFHDSFVIQKRRRRARGKNIKNKE
ncbi:hypothetical protein [Evansella cellulosilytica]|nr:hypothetical protein [Evansella cellulosilytica]